MSFNLSIKKARKQILTSLLIEMVKALKLTIYVAVIEDTPVREKSVIVLFAMACWRPKEVAQRRTKCTSLNKGGPRIPVKDVSG